MDVLVPIAAEDPAFQSAGYNVPKSLVEVRGKPMVQWATSCVEWIDPRNYIFPVLESHIKSHRIDDRLRAIYGPDIEIVPIDGMTRGAAVTALRAREHLSDEDLLILFGDQHIRGPVRTWIRDTEADGVIPIFESSLPKWSYAKTNEAGVVMEVAEKEVISSNATAGLYYFSQGNDFVTGAERMIEKDVRTNGIFYVCPVFNELVQMGRHVETVLVDEMWDLGSPEAVKSFEERFGGT